MCTLWRIRERTTYAVDWHSSAQKADAWDQSLPWCHEIKLYALLEAAWEQKSHKFTKNRAKLIAGRITSRQWLRTMERNRTLSSPIWCFCTSKSQSKHRGPLSRMINHCEKKYFDGYSIVGASCKKHKWKLWLGQPLKRQQLYESVFTQP